MPKISDAKIAVLATNGFEQSELEVPRDKLRGAGATVHVVTPDGQAIKGWDKTDWGSEVEADKSVDAVDVADYDALVLPGGQINPDLLRVDDAAVALIRDFVSNGRVVAAICHAPWLLIEAGVVGGRDMTSYHSIRTDVKKRRRQLGGQRSRRFQRDCHEPKPRRSRRFHGEDHRGG